MANLISLATYKSRGANNYGALTTILIGVNKIRTVEPFVVPASGQPISGVTLASVIKLQKDGTGVDKEVYASTVAVSAILTAANAALA